MAMEVVVRAAAAEVATVESREARVEMGVAEVAEVAREAATVAVGKVMAEVCVSNSIARTPPEVLAFLWSVPKKY